jgi:simple sugar transport system substrate-binding protein
MQATKHILQAALLASALSMGATATIADGMIAVVGGKADDPFFAKVKKGIEEAATVVEQHGGSVNYLMLQTYDNIGGDAANHCDLPGSRRYRCPQLGPGYTR